MSKAKGPDAGVSDRLMATFPVGGPEWHPASIPDSIRAESATHPNRVWLMFRYRFISFDLSSAGLLAAPGGLVPSIAGAFLTRSRAAHAGVGAWTRRKGRKLLTAHPRRVDDRIIFHLC